ncbi:hypothetical protein [methane-oxidizing endosymbiont of Gigantopelta aegis]|uniref:hypothetical protein n=1 Tax=methane-oxidizing endosymbiont of Gigantopelta aegis TaxID=2794938 RepID=UPI003CC94CF1
MTFVCWFNNEHQHSALKFVTPNQRHNGLDSAVLEKENESSSKQKETIQSDGMDDKHEI